MSAGERVRNGGKGALVLGLDPSSSRVGYGVLTAHRQFVETGLLLPDSGVAPSWSRVQSLADEVERLLERLGPSVVLVEWTRGKVNLRRHHGLGAGLAVYGCGVGAIGRQVWLWARGRSDVTVEAVLENDWTRGQNKRDRQMATASLYPAYAESMADDPGGDMADGLGLAHWWLCEQLLHA